MKNKILYTVVSLLGVIVFAMLSYYTSGYYHLKQQLSEYQQSNIVKVYEEYEDPNDTIPLLYFGYNGHDHIGIHDPNCWCHSQE